MDKLSQYWERQTDAFFDMPSHLDKVRASDEQQEQDAGYCLDAPRHLLIGGMLSDSVWRDVGEPELMYYLR